MSRNRRASRFANRHLVALAAACVCLLLASSIQAQGPRPVANKGAIGVVSRVNAPALSLAELVKHSEHIFTAQVVGIDEAAPGTLGQIAIALKVVRPIRGQRADFVAYQDPILRSPVRKDDKVLWFLARKSKQDLSVPVGYWSGHFELVDGDLKNGSFQNAYGNLGLWRQSLWDSVSKAKVRARLTQDHDIRIEDPKKLEEVLSKGDVPSNGPLPLSLLVAIIRTMEQDTRGPA